MNKLPINFHNSSLPLSCLPSILQRMGSCISRSRKPKKHKISPKEEHGDSVQVQDKLVIISQAPSPLPCHNRLQPNSSPSHSSSSGSTLSGISSSSSSSLSLSSSATSSVSGLKDRAFSNEFLWNCVMENPHIVRRDQVKGSPVRVAQPKSRPKNPESPSKSSKLTPATKPSIPQLQKQRSFRKELERPEVVHRTQSPIYNRGLRSPSPSRRFGVRNRGVSKSRAMERGSATKDSVVGLCTHNKPQVKSISTVNDHPFLRKSCISRQIGSRIEEFGGMEEKSGNWYQEEEEEEQCVLTEDLDNPLISLDCFIFL